MSPKQNERLKVIQTSHLNGIEVIFTFIFNVLLFLINTNIVFIMGTSS